MKHDHMLQVSTVSRQHAAAAVQLLSLPGTCLDFTCTPTTSCLDNSLLLSWAPCFSRTYMNNKVLHVPGVDRFMTHATSLCAVFMSSCSPLTSARFNELLSLCAAVTELHCTKSYLPYILSANLSKLSVDIYTIAEQLPEDSGVHQLLEILVVRLNTCRCQLHSLEINYGRWPALGCQVCLPALKRLHVHFEVSEQSAADLNWLRVQPCDNLIVDLDLEDPAPQTSLHIVHALQQLSMQELTL